MLYVFKPNDYIFNIFVHINKIAPQNIFFNVQNDEINYAMLIFVDMGEGGLETPKI